MAKTRQWRNFHPSRMELLSIGGVLVAIPVYLAVLHVLDGRAEAYFTNLRGTDTELYLTQIRESRGFADYVDEYREMRGYDSSQTAAPSFLVGRWTMRPEPLRLTPGTPPGHCIDPVTFDYGILLMSAGRQELYNVSYRIEGQSVHVEAGGTAQDGGADARPAAAAGIAPLGQGFTVDLVSYGARLDHLEFQPPGRDEQVYAYNCGG